MLRRLFALILAIACAVAPGVAASGHSSVEVESCCCGTKCPCPPSHCALPPAPTSTALPATATVLEQRSGDRRLAMRGSHVRDFACDFSLRKILSARVLRPSATDRAAPAASVALFQAHCSLLI